MKIQVCKLKNGSTEALPVVVTTMMSIKHLTTPVGDPLNDIQNLLAVYELGKLASDSKYQIFSPELGDTLKSLNLLSGSNTLNSSVKNIAQSAITFNGEMPVIDNPILEILGDNLDQG